MGEEALNEANLLNFSCGIWHCELQANLCQSWSNASETLKTVVPGKYLTR